MHTVKLIVGSIAAMIAVDVLLGLADPHQLLPTELCVDIGVHGMTASVFLIPALFIFVPPRRGSKRNLFVRTPLAVLVAWFAMIEFRMQFALPALRELALQRDDYMYDGIGMNAVVLVMGWVPPLIVTVVMIAESIEIAESFILEVERNTHAPGNAILVFSNGRWNRSESLFEAIQSATFDDLILADDLRCRAINYRMQENDTDGYCWRCA